MDGWAVHSLLFSSESIISQIIGDELLEQLQPHRRVKRREKILPGPFTFFSAEDLSRSAAAECGK